MNDFFKLTFASALMLGVATGVAHSQEADGAPPADGIEEMEGLGGHHKGGHYKRGGRHKMQIIDANADGVIGEDEAAAVAERHFMHMDRDRDGQLTEAEFTAPPHRGRGWFNWGGEEAAAVVKVRKDKFAALDTDKNGNVTKLEFFADAKQRLASADTDKDGKVSPWEYRISN